MQGTSSSSLCSSLILPPKPSLSHSTHRQTVAANSKRRSTKICAAQRDAHGQKSNGSGGGGGCVDEDMLVLRMRIHDIKKEEEKDEAPSNWMEWEKKYYANYTSDICEALGLLQTNLMNTRPSLVLAMAVFIALSVATSSAMVASQLVEIVKWILIGFC